LLFQEDAIAKDPQRPGPSKVDFCFERGCLALPALADGRLLAAGEEEPLA
jgi:hypothetical protein